MAQMVFFLKLQLLCRAICSIILPINWNLRKKMWSLIKKARTLKCLSNCPTLIDDFEENKWQKFDFIVKIRVKTLNMLKSAQNPAYSLNDFEKNRNRKKRVIEHFIGKVSLSIRATRASKKHVAWMANVQKMQSF